MSSARENLDSSVRAGMDLEGGHCRAWQWDYLGGNPIYTAAVACGQLDKPEAINMCLCPSRLPPTG